jgi:hypothetical protein
MKGQRCHEDDADRMGIGHGELRGGRTLGFSPKLA